MREWLLLVTAGFMSSVGTVAAASGVEVRGTFYGAFVLVLIFALWWSNGQLDEGRGS